MNEELFRADLRSKEVEISALRGSVMTAMASRQIALDKRRLDAVDQLWSAVAALGPAKAISSFIASLKFEAVAEEAAKDPKFRQMFSIKANVEQAAEILRRSNALLESTKQSNLHT